MIEIKKEVNSKIDWLCPVKDIIVAEGDNKIIEIMHNPMKQKRSNRPASITSICFAGF